MANEKRRYPRYKGLKPVPVAWMCGTQKHVAKAENLSLGGLFIGTSNPPSVGSAIAVSHARKRSAREGDRAQREARQRHGAGHHLDGPGVPREIVALAAGAQQASRSRA